MVMSTQKYFIPIVIGFIFLLLISSTLFLYLKTRGILRTSEDASRVMPDLQTKKQRPLETSGFSNKAYINPLASNATGSLYSSRVQLRGVVESWSSDTLRIKINDTVKEIRFPVAVKLYCAPSSYVDKDGNPVPATTVGLDFSKSGDIGTLTATTNISKKIPKGGDVTVLANVGDGDLMTAYLVVGYGCGGK